MIDGDSVVARLCVAGMAVDGDAVAAGALFRQAWDARRDDYEASIAAHFLARHQPSLDHALHWNRVAVEHAEAVTDERAKPLLASLYLNLADSYLALGDSARATIAAEQGVTALQFLPADGYRDFVSRGLERVHARIARTSPVPDTTG
jgi:tetratricopeptide (TPR) repeat protein